MRRGRVGERRVVVDAQVAREQHERARAQGAASGEFLFGERAAQRRVEADRLDSERRAPGPGR